MDLSIIIPAFNEEKRLAHTVEDVHEFVKTLGSEAEIIVVDDGSDDGTLALAQQLPGVRVLQHTHNEGKGWAVRTGVLGAHGALILVLDADGSTPIHSLPKLTSELKDIAIGSRYLPQSQIGISQSALRIRIGRLGNTLIRWLILPGIRDTQCGFKLFTREAAQCIFPKQTIRRWGYDMEILAIAKLHNLHIREVPVEWNHAEFSRLRPIRDALKTLSELVYIKFNLLLGRYKG